MKLSCGTATLAAALGASAADLGVARSAGAWRDLTGLLAFMLARLAAVWWRYRSGQWVRVWTGCHGGYVNSVQAILTGMMKRYSAVLRAPPSPRPA